MNIHILQHESFESPAIIEDWIKKKNYSSTYTKFYKNGRLPNMEKIDWLIIMGGPMNTNDEENFPWLKQEKEFIKKATDAGKVVLGICLGAQLIASALGAKVYKNKYKEIGWMNVNLIENLKDNFLFSSLPKTIRVCQWHGNTFDLPKGAVLLAESEACKNQAFVYNEKVIGLQFHLEFTESTIKDLINNCRKELVKDKYVQTENEILQNLKFLKTTNSLLFDILDRIDKKIN